MDIPDLFRSCQKLFLPNEINQLLENKRNARNAICGYDYGYADTITYGMPEG